MRLLLLALSLAPCLFAQEFLFVEQPLSRIPGLREHKILVRADAILPSVEGLALVREAVHRDLRVFLPVNLQQYVNELNKRSPLRVLSIAVEVVAYVTSTGVVLEKIVVKEPWAKDIIASVGPGLTFTRLLWEKNEAPVVVPADGFLPGTFSVGPGMSREFTIWSL